MVVGLLELLAATIDNVDYVDLHTEGEMDVPNVEQMLTMSDGDFAAYQIQVNATQMFLDVQQTFME